ncbi:MAG TPA: ATP-binding protein, partial [bacterium]|nr:ATP-binding protein [bacterium]
LHETVTNTENTDPATIRPVLFRLKEHYETIFGEITADLDPLLKNRFADYHTRIWPAMERWNAAPGTGEIDPVQVRSDLKALRKIVLLAAKRLEKESLAERRGAILRSARFAAASFAVAIAIGLFGIIAARRSRQRRDASAAPAEPPTDNPAGNPPPKEHRREQLLLKRYRDILDSLPDGVVVSDASSGRVQFINRTFRDRFAVGQDQIGETVAALAEKSGMAIAEPGKLTAHDTVYWRDITEVGGAVLHLVRDMTEQDRLSNRLMSAERLISIGEIASKVTHEIRNPLSTIKLNVEYVADHAHDLSPEELSASIALIVKEVIRLEEITDRYMGMVRYRADEESPSRTPLRDAVAEVTRFHESEFRTRDIALTVGDLPAVELGIAFNSFREVLLNILKNAWEELDRRGAVAISGDIADGKVRLFVDDSGHGVPAAEREKIFRNFYTTKPGGTGIGLSHSLKLVTEAGGDIAVTDSPLGGARFVITIPRG